MREIAVILSLIMTCMMCTLFIQSLNWSDEASIHSSFFGIYAFVFLAAAILFYKRDMK